jgi:hypothetical protein
MRRRRRMMEMYAQTKINIENVLLGQSDVNKEKAFERVDIFEYQQQLI